MAARRHEHAAKLLGVGWQIVIGEQRDESHEPRIQRLGIGIVRRRRRKFRPQRNAPHQIKKSPAPDRIGSIRPCTALRTCPPHVQRLEGLSVRLARQDLFQFHSLGRNSAACVEWDRAAKPPPAPITDKEALTRSSIGNLSTISNNEPHYRGRPPTKPPIRAGTPKLIRHQRGAAPPVESQPRTGSHHCVEVYVPHTACWVPSSGPR